MSAHARTKLTLGISLGAAALTVLAGCGDDGGNAATPPVPTGASSSSSSTTPFDTHTPPIASSSPTAPASGPTTTPTTTTTPTSAPTSAPTEKPRLIAYAGGESPGVVITDPKQVDKLRGAPSDFRDFIAQTVTEINDKSTCNGAAVGVTVQTLRTDGFAVGGVNDCGGYQALWVKVDGAWRQTQGTQDTWTCAGLEKYQVPSDVAGEQCYDPHANKAEHYHQA